MRVSRPLDALLAPFLDLVDEASDMDIHRIELRRTIVHAIDANWKERLAQPYLYVEHVGDYRRMGDAMRRLFASAQEAGLEPSGAPFALFFDDPSLVPARELRARACIPCGIRELRESGRSGPAGMWFALRENRIGKWDAPRRGAERSSCAPKTGPLPVPRPGGRPRHGEG